MKKLFHLLLLLILILVYIKPLPAQEHTIDENTLLLLHFNDNLNGEQGEFPSQASGVNYEEGIFENGAYFSNTNQVLFSAVDNVNEMEGTLEFWIKPNWNGSDGIDHYMFRYGLWGGMFIGKDAGNYWNILMNRWAPTGYPMVAAGIFITNEWLIDVWHHAAFTWNGEKVQVYIDGELRAETPVTVPLFNITDTYFQLGAADEYYGFIDAVIDELRISNTVRSAQEILDSYTAGFSVGEIILIPEVVDLMETWWFTPDVNIQSELGTIEFPASELNWTSLDNNIATVNENGRIEAISAGTTTIIGEYEGNQDSITVNVSSPLIPSGMEIVPAYLSTPVEDHLWEMPVVIIQFLPTTDGVNIDPSVSGWSSSINELKDRIEIFNKRVKYMLEEGSQFRGYNNNDFPPSLGYKVIDIISVYEEMPKSEFEIGWNPGVYHPDYYQILSRFNAEYYVNNLGVKEFWIWGYHYDDIEPAESNMSSPITGDISNSQRFEDDLPIFDHTYVVYNYNFTRTQAEAVHNHGHQFEVIYKHAAIQQDGHYNLFVHNFCGWGLDYSTPPIGRAGDTHHPPNTTIDYDYVNMTLVESDIEDWIPDNSGGKTYVNANTWGTINYNWPIDVATNIPQKTESQWYIYWMQNMPGYGNIIEHGENFMNNWWIFTADWDSAMINNIGLYGPEPTISPEITLDLKVFLEGPFNGIQMNSNLNSFDRLPLVQPYNGYPWNYSGTEQVSSIPNSDIVDWVLVELRETTGDASTATPATMIHQQAAFIKSDGSIVNMDGSSLLSYPGEITDNLYIIILHRNHLGVMSSGPLAEAGGLYSWDFRNSQTQAYLNGQKVIGSGIFGMAGGDCDANGIIENSDKNFCWILEAGNMGYYFGDWNLDNQVNNPDKNDIWIENFGLESTIPITLTIDCGEILIDPRDSKEYNTVLIGSQCWMAENLNVGTMINSSLAPSNNDVIEKYCYGDNPVNCNNYGGLYEFWESIQYTYSSPVIQGVCPEGWHLPTETEWCELVQFIDASVSCTGSGYSGTNGGYKMKSTTGWNSNGNGSNSSGFNALPGGNRELYPPPVFAGLNESAAFWGWESDFTSYFDSFGWLLSSASDGVGHAPGALGDLSLSVRCIKNTASK